MKEPPFTAPKVALPAKPRPIAIIGAGSVVRDAHLPAYRKAGFPVVAIADLSEEKARALAEKWAIPSVHGTVEALVSSVPAGTVFDVALPADQFAQVLLKLPEGSAVLIQKPLGETIAQAKEIVGICRARRLLAAANFQLRFAPFVVAAKAAIDRGVIGDVRDVEFRVTVETPWDRFPFLKGVRRLEILYHSVHYIDCMRHFLGEPKAVLAKTLRHPELDMPESRSLIILDYGDRVRANIETNHFHRFGPRHQESFIKWEGTAGAIVARMGLLLNYPKGEPDSFEICTFVDGRPVWQEVAIEGSWFPDAFIGSMAQVQRAASGERGALVTPVEDALLTMACLEAAYTSSERGGVSPKEFL